MNTLLQRNTRKVPGRSDEPDTEQMAKVLESFAQGWAGERPGPRQDDPRYEDYQQPLPAALIVDYASRIPTQVNQLSDDERTFFLRCLKIAQEARPFVRPKSGRALFNPVIWLADGERDLPAWLVTSGVRVRSIGVPVPDLGQRRRMAKLLAERAGCTRDGSRPGRGPPGQPGRPGGSDGRGDRAVRASGHRAHPARHAGEHATGPRLEDPLRPHGTGRTHLRVGRQPQPVDGRRGGRQHPGRRGRHRPHGYGARRRR